MAKTVFIPRQTLITAAWLNEVEAAKEFLFMSDNTDITQELTDLLTSLASRYSTKFAGQRFNTTPLVINFMGAKYDLSGPIVLNSDLSGICLFNGTFNAVGSNPWTTGESMFRFTGSSGASGKSYMAGLNLVTLNCNKKTSGVRYDDTVQLICTDVNCFSFTDYGIKLDVRNGKSAVVRPVTAEYSDGSAASRNFPGRTGTGIWVEKTDGYVTGGNFGPSKTAMRFSNIQNFIIDNCHPWIGQVDDENDKLNAYVVDIGPVDTEYETGDGGAAGLIFTQCYFDNGRIRMTDSFANQFTNNLFALKNTAPEMSPFVLVATEPGETACGLHIVNMRPARGFNSELIEYQTSGSGSWSERKLIEIVAAGNGSKNLQKSKLVSSVYFMDSGENANATGAFDGLSRIQISDHTSEIPIATRLGNYTVHSQYAGTGSSFSQWGTNAKGPGVWTAYSRSTTVGAFGGYPQAGDVLGRFGSTGDNGTSFGIGNKPGALMTITAPATWTSTSNPTKITWSTTSTGAVGDAVDRISLDDAGNLQPETNNVYKLGGPTFNWSGTYSTAYYVGSTKVVGARETGWTAGTGTANKGAFTTGTATTADCAQRILALEQALRTHGLIN